MPYDMSSVAGKYSLKIRWYDNQGLGKEQLNEDCKYCVSYESYTWNQI